MLQDRITEARAIRVTRALVKSIVEDLPRRPLLRCLVGGGYDTFELILGVLTDLDGNVDATITCLQHMFRPVTVSPVTPTQ